MQIDNLHQELRSNLEGYHCKMQITPIEHLTDLENEFRRCTEEGMIGQELTDEYLVNFFDSTKIFEKAKSLIIVAIPQPITQVNFSLNQKRYPVLIPPTYLATEDDRQVNQIISKTVNSAGYSSKRAIGLPLKLLAVSTGLGKYGKNNICYIPGMGSFHRLLGFYSDLPSTTDNWFEPEVMARCAACMACRQSCPTGCIPNDRFIIQAEKCLTFVNESSRPFPPWVDQSWHNALVGCLHCQTTCPENQDFLSKVIAEISFGEEETTKLLMTDSFEEISPVTQDKIRVLEMDQVYNLFRRNLQALIKN